MIASFDWIAALAESPISLVLVGCSILTLGVALERALYHFRIRDDSDVALRETLERVRSGDMQAAARRCEQTLHPFGAVGRRLFEVKDPLGRIADERIAVALTEQRLLFEKNLGLLGTMAAIAPLIGLLGTVWGIMRAFGDMARIGSAAPSVVAAGVAEALVTTGAGLVVAVPALVLYNHFARRANRMLAEGENHTRSLRATLAEFHVPETEPSSERIAKDRPGQPAVSDTPALKR